MNKGRRDSGGPSGLLALLLGLYMVLLIIFIALCAGAFGIVHVLAEEGRKPRPLPPLYQDARQVQQQVVTERDGNKRRIVSFVTADTSSAVLSYYEHYMTGVGWEFLADASAGTPGMYQFSYWLDGGPNYVVTISAQDSETGQTKVEIQMSSIGTGWYGEELKPAEAKK